MFGDSHLFGVASSGASWCIDGILCFKNKILGSEFGGYTAHHLINRLRLAQLRSLVGSDQRVTNF